MAMIFKKMGHHLYHETTSHAALINGAYSEFYILYIIIEIPLCFSRLKHALLIFQKLLKFNIKNNSLIIQCLSKPSS